MASPLYTPECNIVLSNWQIHVVTDQQNISKYVLGFLPSRQKSESHNDSCIEFKEQHVTEIGIP